jgi:hypothetical protein
MGILLKLNQIQPWMLLLIISQGFPGKRLNNRHFQERTWRLQCQFGQKDYLYSNQTNSINMSVTPEGARKAQLSLSERAPVAHAVLSGAENISKYSKEYATMWLLILFI